MRLLRTLWHRTRRILNLGVPLLAVHPKSILVVDGWNHSFQSAQAVDRQNNPIPWYTYAAIRFLESRLRRQLRVFEYGCGNSTLWYAQRASQVIAVEHDAQWAETMTQKLRLNSANCQVIHREQGESYIREVEQHGPFDIIVIDGVNRSECCKPSLGALTPEGVIIWDNSDREDFAESRSLWQQSGFRELPFYGLTPITFVPSQTSVLYREQNCLEI